MPFDPHNPVHLVVAMIFLAPVLIVLRILLQWWSANYWIRRFRAKAVQAGYGIQFEQALNYQIDRARDARRSLDYPDIRNAFREAEEQATTSCIKPEGKSLDTGSQAELTALRGVLRMMGLDPMKVAAFGATPTDFACKAILFECVGLDESKLVARVGENANLDGWRSYWNQLQIRTE